MKKLKWNRKLSILVLIMFVTVSFASFNTNLFIDGKGYVRVDKDIRITNIRLLESEYNGYENTSSEYTNRTISTDVSLPRQASSVTYEVTVSNVSDKRYKITDIIEESYDNRNVKYELIDASIGNIVEPHTEKTFKVKFTNNVTVVEEDDVYQTLTYTFDYTGGEQEFIVPYDGTYTLEVWGAQGGNNGGLGGYSIGKIQLKKGKSLFINVGGAGIKGCDQTLGNDVFVNGGYNGGGSTYTWKDNKCAGSGGGATHISYKKGLLSSLENRIESILIVAGGGGGQGISGYGTAGSGGGYIGNSGTATDSWYGTGGTQEQGGKDKNSSAALVHSGFGQGTSLRYGNGSGGGGGYYGGGAGYGAGGFSGGGSGYIGNTLLYDKAMYCYKCAESSEDNTKTITTNDNSTTPETNKAKKGNGYAKITLTRKIEDGSEYDFDYTGGEQTFTVPYSGLYKLETWGAQGGSDRSGTSGGYGGYSTGQIELIKNTNLYLYNGGKGTAAGAANTTSLGGYNGGGNASSKSAADTSNWGAGGGASHIAFEQGLLSTYSDTSKLSNLLIVAGAGGGAGNYGNNSNNGGSGGGYIGSSGIGEGFGTGGTQVSGGIGDTKEKPTDDGKIGLGGNFDKTEWGAGGGSGFYGGGVGYRHGGSAGGGSGYIANENLKNKIMYCYNCEESNDINTKTVSTQSHSKMPKQNIAKEGNGFSRVTLLKRTINQTKLTLDFTFEEYLNGNEYTFGYTGDEQIFIVPKTGVYRLETWGAQGGYQYIPGGDLSLKDEYSSAFSGGYSSGLIKLNKSEKLYINVGGAGENNDYSDGGSATGAAGGYNGGGAGGNSNNRENFPGGSGGGGATHIAMKTGLLSELSDSLDSILIVSGGSGGYSLYQEYLTSAGAGGGFEGNSSSGSIQQSHSFTVLGGTQTQGYAFGLGQTAIGSDTENVISFAQSGRNGGGGGFYGGYAQQGVESYTACQPGGGGSGYIANSYLYDKHMTCYNCQTSDDESTKTISNTCSDSNPTADCSKQGDGFAKITLVETIPEYTFDYTGESQEFVAPYNGLYKVELWGASGGSGSADGKNYKYPGGNGAYTSGKIILSKNQKLYLYVGKEGAKHACDSEELSPPSFNGGGAGGFDAATNNTSDGGGSGGGATDIRLTSGQWNNFDGLKSRIMVAAGGGGGSWPTYSLESGQNASGLYVKGLKIKSHNSVVSITDGTQFSGYKFGVGKDGEPDAPNAAIGGDGGGYWTGVYDATMRNGIGGTSYISGHQGCVSISESSIEDNISFVNDSNGVSCGSDTSLGYNASGYNTDSLCSNHYSDMEFYDTSMIDGAGHPWTASGSSSQVVEIPSHDGRTTMVGNTGNGYAKITLLQKSTDVVRDNLLLYLDAKNPGNTEGIWEDKSGNGFNGTIIDGNFNQNALKLNSSTSGVFMGDQLIDLFKDNFTLEVYLNSTDTDSRGIVMGNHPRDGGHSMSIERGSSGGLDYKEKGRFYFNESNPNYVTTVNYIKNGKQQLFFIFDKDNNKVIFGKNGQVVEEYSNSAFEDDFDFNNSYLFRDKREGVTTYKCEAYSVRLYNRAVSLNELKSNFIYDKIYYK